MRLSTLSTLFFFSALPLCAQDPVAADTRAGQIEAAHQAKASAIPPEKPPSLVGKSESIFAKAFKVWNVSRTGGHGPSLRLGGLPDGSGLALGPDYTLKFGELYDPDVVWDSYAIGSLKGFYRVQTSVELPRLFNDRVFLSASAFRFDYPRLPYYGEGSESRLTGRTDYRMQDDALQIRGGYRLSRKLRAGLEGSFQRIDIRSGTDPGIAQAGGTYQIPNSQAQARGVDFVTGGFFVQYDNRDEPLNPRKGTLLRSDFQNVNGSPSRLGEFNRYDFEAQQYLHFWNKRRVIAMRVKSAMTTPHSGSTVPFYLEPSLGGSNDLRGFRPYRFYDRNSVVATAEYRWAVMQVLDMALFADAGKVYHDAATFSLSRMKADIGVGLRGKVGNNVPIRIDVGCSREGVQVWLTFYNVF